MVLFEGGDPVSVSYPYGDLEDGIGATTYYLFTSTATGGTTRMIGKDQPFSSRVTEGSGTAIGTFSDDYYTGTFKVPKRIQGTIINNFVFASLGTAAGDMIANIAIKIYHYDPSGPTSTQIGSTWTSGNQVSNNGDDAKIETMVALTEIPTAVLFARGTQIRVEIIVTKTDNTGRAEYGIDPGDRDSTETVPLIQPSVDPQVTTVHTMTVPFKIQGN